MAKQTILAQNPDLRLSRENRSKSPLEPITRTKGRKRPEQPQNGENQGSSTSQGRVFTLELPLPPIQASPNGRFHWGAKARAVREYRNQCGFAARLQIGQRRSKGMVTVDLAFYLASAKIHDDLYRPRDRDNALSSVKAAIDSLRDCGLIRNDSKKHLNIGTVDLYTTKKEHQGQTKLVMTIREA